MVLFITVCCGHTLCPHSLLPTRKHCTRSVVYHTIANLLFMYGHCGGFKCLHNSLLSLCGDTLFTHPSAKLMRPLCGPYNTRMAFLAILCGPLWCLCVGQNTNFALHDSSNFKQHQHTTKTPMSVRVGYKSSRRANNKILVLNPLQILGKNNGIP